MVIVVQDVGIGFIIASEAYAFIKSHSRDNNSHLTTGLPLTHITHTREGHRHSAGPTLGQIHPA